MTKSFPYLALDSAGRRTILCDHPVPMFGDNTTKKETTKMRRTMSTSEAKIYGRLFPSAAADKFFAKCMGQDAAMDDETVARIKEFLSDKLSDKDHTALCAMLAGDFEAEDTEPAPGDPDAEPQGKLASDTARDDFNRRFPDASRTRIDNSGIQPRRRASSYSAAGAASFTAMFPDQARIKLA
jgi:hypothetical protein